MRTAAFVDKITVRVRFLLERSIAADGLIGVSERSIAADGLSHVVGLRATAFVTPVQTRSTLDHFIAADGLSYVVGLRTTAFVYSVAPVWIGFSLERFIAADVLCRVVLSA